MQYINNLNLAIYTYQQNLSLALYYNSDFYDIAQYVTLFLGGVITSLNPCSISIFPILFSYINNSKKTKDTTNKLIIGIFISRTIIIGTSILLNEAYKNFSHYIPFFTSISTILIGLNLLQILYLSNFSINKYLIFLSKLNKVLKDYSIGLILGFSSLSCTTSIHFALGQFINSPNNNNITLSLFYITIYILGYMSPVVILTNINNIYIKLNNITRTWNTISYLNGCLVLSFGIFHFLETLLR